MTDLKYYLQAIEGDLKRLNRPVVDLLQVGLGRSLIGAQLSAHGLPSENEIIEAYEWKNGTRVSPGASLDDLHFFPGFYFLSLEGAFEHYLLLVRGQGWSRYWFPMFTNGGGDFYAVDLSANGRLHAPVIGFLRGEDDHPVEYESLTAMAATLHECYLQKAFFVTSNNYLEMASDLHRSIAKQLNPSVILWK